MTNKNTGEHRMGSFWFLLWRSGGAALRMECVTEDAGRPFLFCFHLLFSSLHRPLQGDDVS
jgi:hypothetical protein